MEYECHSLTRKTQVKLEIERLSYGPYGIGRVDGRVLMVPHTAPGDTIMAHVVEEKERFSMGEIARILAPSPARRHAALSLRRPMRRLLLAAFEL